MRWPRGPDGRPNPLRVGDEVTETTRVLSAEPKIVKNTGEDMIVVGVEKEFANGDGVAVVDRRYACIAFSLPIQSNYSIRGAVLMLYDRNWVFRKALTEPIPTTSTTSTPITSSPMTTPLSFTTSSGTQHTRTLRQTPVTLFRFSALTFNPHKIHYSLPWARDVEGHKSVVVHGPLNLISILDLWRDIRGCGSGSGSGSGNGEVSGPGGFLPESVQYRATSPLYAGDEYRVVLEDEDGDGKGKGKGARVQIFNPEGVVAMKADVKG